MKIRVKYFEGATKLEKIAKGNWIDVYANKEVFVKERLEKLDEKREAVFVAELEGKVAGYVFCIITETKNSTMLFDMKTNHLEDVCIDESCRGMGIGGALMEYVTAWAKENGCDRMDLDVWEFNEGARRFYERYGFQTQKRRMDKWL